MKNKILIPMILVAMLAVMLVIPSHATGDDFRFTFSGLPEKVESGDTISFDLTLSDVRDANGIFSSDFLLHYDTSVYEFTDAVLKKQPTINWFCRSADHADEQYATLFLVDNMVSDPAKAGEIVINVTLKVKDNAPQNKATVFLIDEINGSDSAANFIEGATTQATVIVNQLPGLSLPSVSAQTDNAKGGIAYTVNDPNDPASVKDYTVTLRRASDRAGVASVTSTSKTGFFAASAAIAPSGESYIVSVVANAKPGNADSAEADSASVVMGDCAASLTVANQPKLAYAVGQTLDLTGLNVTVKYASGKTETVAFADFSAHGLTASPASGTALAMSNGKAAVIITMGTLSAKTMPLTVTEKVCEHKNTHTDEIAATCGADGSSVVLCDDCGAVLSVTALTERPDHTFGEKEKTYYDPETGSTVYTSTCSACGETKQEIVMETPDTATPDTEPVSPDTTAPSTADPQNTTPADDKKEGGCGSVVSSAVGAVTLVLGAAVVMLRRRENH